MPDQNGLSPTIPGCSALTRIGAISSARALTSPTTPPLTVETVTEPGYGRSLARPPKSTTDDVFAHPRQQRVHDLGIADELQHGEPVARSMS